MYSLIALVRDNEALLVKKAKLLGYSRIYFVYEQTNKVDLGELEIKYSVEIKKVILCNKKNCFELRKKRIITMMETSSDRDVFERVKPRIAYGLEQVGRGDAVHQRVSGLNHIMCGLAKKNKIAVLFDLGKIKTNDSVLIGRMRQNIKLCKKYKVEIILSLLTSDPNKIVSPTDLMSFGKLLGLSHTEARKAVSYEL